MDDFEHLKPIPTRENLRERYPQSMRLILVRSFWFLLGLLVVVIGYFVYLYHFITAGAEPPAPIVKAIDFIYYVTLAVVLLKLIYEFIFYMVYAYGIELEHFTITKGIFFRSRSSFPFAKINDASLKRNPIEMIFFVYSMDVLTASPLHNVVENFGTIEGLSKKNAVGLQSHILSLVETTLPDVKEAAAKKVIDEDLSSEESDRIIHGKAVNF